MKKKLDMEMKRGEQNDAHEFFLAFMSSIKTLIIIIEHVRGREIVEHIFNTKVETRGAY